MTTSCDHSWIRDDKTTFPRARSIRFCWRCARVEVLIDDEQDWSGFERYVEHTRPKDQAE
jgi:hypothetical protein